MSAKPGAAAHRRTLAEAHTLAKRYQDIRNATERLAQPLSAEDCAIQSMPDASPTKWHLAHTSWFFETFILENAVKRYKPFHPLFRVLFNSYYNAVGDRHPRPQRGVLSRPSLDEVRRYRKHVDEQLLALLAEPRALDAQALELVELGLQHEQQHQELILTDSKHMLSLNPLKPVYYGRWPLVTVKPRRPRWHAFEEGVREIGHRGEGFGFDNESPRHRVFVQAFELACHPVTHGDFLRFIDDGGYRRPELWLSAGWDWLRANGVHAPLYWEERDGKWWTFTLHGMAEIDPNTPVCHVSYYEADAYARWAGARLPSEAEWEIAGESAPIEGNFRERGAFHPLPLADDRANDYPAQLYGDVWEWTRSDYGPYPGFKTAAGAVGEYNGKFMCGQYVLRGGSCATPSSHIRATYRNFFPPDARWQFSGIRLARDLG